MRFLAFAFAILPLLAGVDGVVMNATTGKPQPGVAMAMVQPSERGMETLDKTVSSATGAFSFEKDPPANAPILLQSVHAGVTYTKALNPGQPRAGIQVAVYEASAKPSGVAVNRHGILLEPAEGKLAVREFVFVDNASKTTYSDPANGTYRFWAPDDARIEISLTTQGGMPVKRPARKSGAARIWTVDYPIRPGQTQIEISYESPDAETFSGNILHKEGETRLIVPKGLALKGAGLEEYAPEPQTQAAIYGVQGGPFTVAIRGKAATREAKAAGGEEGGAPEVLPGRPRVYDRLYWILGITAAILLLGLLSLSARSVK